MHKLFTHQYFLEDADMSDIVIVLKHIEYAEVIGWQQTRELMLSVLRPYLKKHDITAKDLLPLPTDEVHIPNHEISNDEVSWYKQYVENYKKQQNTIL